MSRLTLIVCGVLMALVLGVFGGRHKQDLADFILSNYDNRVMPDDQVTTNVGIMLRNILDLDTEKGILSLDVWFDMSWTDDRLAWNDYEKYDDLKELSLPASAVWIPDITLYNSPDGFISFNKDVDVLIGKNGSMTYMPPATFHTYCNIDNDFESTGLTRCTLTFGSWVHRLLDLDTQLFRSDIDASAMVREEGQWTYVNSTATRNEVTYACCPDVYVTVSFEVLLMYNGE